MTKPTGKPVREPARAAAFCDAVVAVAMTALVLPLLSIDVASVSTFSELMAAYGDQFTAFLLSFFIIAIYWNVHHKVWFAVRTVTPLLLWLNMFWLLGIVLIPFATITIYETKGFPVLGFQIYSGVVFFVSLMLGMITYLIMRDPELNVGNVVPQPWWYALRYGFWWLIVFLACVINAEGIGQYLLEWSAIPMVLLGSWRPASVKRAAARLRQSGQEVMLD